MPTLKGQRLHSLSPRSELDLTKYVVNPNHVPPVYDLYAVINHYGGLGGGHCKCGCVDIAFVFRFALARHHAQVPALNSTAIYFAYRHCLLPEQRH